MRSPCLPGASRHGWLETRIRVSHPEDADPLIGSVASGMPLDECVEMARLLCHANLFYRPHKQSIIFRLSDEDQAAFLKLEWGGGIRANARRKMKGYVILGDRLRQEKSTASGAKRRWAATGEDGVRGKGRQSLAPPQHTWARGAKTLRF